MTPGPVGPPRVARPLAAVALILLFVLGSLVAPGISRAQTPAGDAVGTAGMVIDIGEGEPIRVVVAFGGDGISAIDLLREADLGLVSVGFGGLGEGVCEIVDTGCDVSSCRARLCQSGDPESPFWQLRVLRDDAWAFSSLGASGLTVGDGDIVAWVWTGGEPDLAPVTWEQLAVVAGAPEPVIQRTGTDTLGTWSSAAPGADDPPISVTELLVSSGVIVLLAAGGLLAVRRRQRPA